MTEHHGAAPGIGDLLWPALNFLIFVALLVRFLSGPIKEFFRERTERLREGLAAGRRARAEAEALRAEIERASAELPALRERMVADLRAAAERERQAMLESGRTMAERIRRDSRTLADQELVAARQALRAELADDAVRQAAELLRRALGSEDQDRFVREFVQIAEVGR
jgi:F-type H+-transporting ATPase subunit b